MKYDLPLIEGTLIKRYKRFLADIRLSDGTEVTVHCPNTGSMKRCAEPGSRVWISDSWYPKPNPKRKYRYTWEWVEVDGKYRVCINTARPNQLIGEALESRTVSGLEHYESLQREPKVEDGRLDFCQMLPDGSRCWIEVKSVTLLEEDNGLGCFPDAVTDRGRKHLRRLQALKQEGDRAVLVFCVPHEGIREVTVADHIDKKYGETLREVMSSGVEVLAIAVNFEDDDSGFEAAGVLPVVV
ncbi:MAG: DNA/RNA nuclease SfsA [Pseudomonadota bacterium]|jgi:sugar fermentation stimulation protein A|nr:DNA/RNA nuclease SfsA [Pseudomonadota bacterium]MEC8523621.1 DNA/RNA nuclease SfsA [Pseudomonadota bacterium]MEE2749560.1 DNA/RNA nuclease SfsA [Pseudomonadota bacterium]